MKTQLIVAALAVASAQPAQLRITVYDGAGISQVVKDAAFDDVRRIFRRAGIEVVLAPGDPRATEATLLPLAGTPAPARRAEAACQARRDIALELVAITPRERNSTILGMAEPFAGNGVNARVFHDRVQTVALAQNRDYAAVLAHVIAHEIGHVLLRDSRHTRHSGLMAAVWTSWEYAGMARSLLFFTAQESERMRATLTGAGCPADSAHVR